jgi:hypothetical protein
MLLNGAAHMEETATHFPQFALLHLVTCVQLWLITILGNCGCVTVASFLGVPSPLQQHSRWNSWTNGLRIMKKRLYTNHFRLSKFLPVLPAWRLHVTETKILRGMVSFRTTARGMWQPCWHDLKSASGLTPELQCLHIMNVRLIWNWPHWLKVTKKLRDFSPPANYTDRTTAACRRS